MRLRTSAALMIATGLAFGLIHHSPSSTVQAADSTNTIQVQGRIAAADCPVSGPLDLTFEIRDSATDTTPASLLFQEEHKGPANAVQVVNGLFSAGLGSTLAAGVPATVFTQPTVGDRWVAVKLGGPSGNEIVSPRLKISAVPFALHSLSGAGGGGVQTINGRAPNAAGELVLTLNGQVPNPSGDFALTLNGQAPNAAGDLLLTLNGQAPTAGNFALTLNGQAPNAAGNLLLTLNGRQIPPGI
jgi:hypothetical protein